jgi:hypothetical protein
VTRALAILLVLAHTAAADDRVAYVTRALAAVHALGPTGRDHIEQELYTAARTRCHADIACLVAAATTLCHGDAACEAAADVAAVNTRATNDWVDETMRARLVRSSADYRAALAAELHHRFAALAAELVLAGGRDAAAIDHLCRERDRAIHACRDDDATCVPSVPWSRCAAALVWFVGSSP